MRNTTVNLTNQLQGQRDDMIKTSWQQKRTKLRENGYNMNATTNHFNKRN